MGDTYDVVVIGSGPGGYVCAIRAAQLGLSVACVEKEATLGGTCLNVGCIPSKALLESSELFHKASKEFKKHGIVVTPELDLPTMMKRKDRIVGTLTRGVAGLFQKNGIATYSGLGRFKSSKEVEVVGEDGAVSATLQAGAVVIATGSKVAPLRGVTMDGERVFGSTEALSLPEVPERLAVIGAGVIGLEMGSVWARLGSRVTVLEYMDAVFPGADADISEQAQKSFRKLGLKFQLGVAVQSAEVTERGVTVTWKNGEATESLEVDRVLVSVGRWPNTDGLNAETIGLALDKRGRVEIDDRWRTNVPGVYAIGDVVKGPMLAHKAEDEGVAVAEILAGKPGHVNFDVIPSVIYTHPEVASVGRTQQQLEADGVAFRVGRFSFLPNGRAKAMEATDGFVKVLSDATTDELLGVHIIGPMAGELIAECALAMEFGASAEDIARTCHAHPTLSEAVKEAALDANGRMIHS
jgi:dihydrolipoamide dehydrogenase